MYEEFREFYKDFEDDMVVGTIIRNVGTAIDPDNTFYGNTTSNISFTCQLFRSNITTNERGLLDELLAAKELIETESCIYIALNDSIISVDGIKKFRINDKIEVGVSKYIVRSLNELNPADEPTPIQTNLLCELQ
jgi:hypothetical protein